MRRSMTMLFLICLLAGCASATATPTGMPASPTPPAEPTATRPPASPTPLPEPTNTPLPATPTPAPRPQSWWDDTTLYEIFVRSFYDSDGDGKGDLNGLIERLDYLNDGDPATDQDLGVTGLWLMPIFESPSYHGYDVTDYLTVNPDYGTNDDFLRLVDEAHRRGIRIIVDLVLNHTSSRHPWFVNSASAPDSERRNWYVWSDTDPGYTGPWGQQVWHYKNGSYYYGLFWGGMPDLNLENPEVTAELYEIARFWLEEMGADGFRLDAARHYIEDGKVQAHTPETHSWLQGFYAFTKEVEPEALTVGEVWDVSDAVATYVGSDMDLAFEFSLATAILLSVNEGRATPLASMMKEVQRLYPQGGFATFLANHDQNRIMDELGRDPDKAKLAATLLLTLPGVPFLYYGEEIGMTGSKPDELIRTPMQWSAEPHAGFTTGKPWEPVNRGFEELNVEEQSGDPDSLLSHYRRLIALRTAHPALWSLAFESLDSADRSVYAYLRALEGDAVLVVVNLGGEAASEYALSSSALSLPPGRYRATDLLTGGEVSSLMIEPDGSVSAYQPLPELPARGALVLHLTPEG